MAKPLIVTLPHSLGAAQAKQRISDGCERLRQQYASQVSRTDIAWRGDQAQVKVVALGQTINARIDVHDDHLLIEVDLPWLLQKLAQPVERFLTRTGAETLRIEKS